VLIAMIATLYELERKMISERTRAGMHRAKLQGKHVGEEAQALGGSKACKGATKPRSTEEVHRRVTRRNKYLKKLSVK